ncbi:MAG: NAD(P)H-dependent oxidoreductase [Acidobacteria bacterium]|nr:MAG: NAD(P)H-dependent oxidoreductase [Acidobacteriota bacterium]REK01956.1 MAG: NAD(P)H-dependent oxidoreductase [Acidobacteriota bacterium]REK14912.1 MAG: NAD(P)H-dependent oxidoreductase [Acidobacteriota bacterium]REK45627.1 MAG: NAD(P)H-dependent oxidoreductase [Acidobacteriota bacterium]
MSGVAEKAGLPSGETILKQLNWRYATKGFDPERKVSDEDWETLKRAGILAPTSYGLQPFRFIVVTDPDLKAKLKPACYGQAQITDCSHLVIVAAKKQLTPNDVQEYADLIIETRGTPRENLEDFIAMMMGTQQKLTETGTALDWSQRQAYIALGFLLYTAAIMGIDACPMEGFDPEKVDEILQLEDYRSSALCALGYRTGEDWLVGLKKVRFPEETLVVTY